LRSGDRKLTMEAMEVEQCEAWDSRGHNLPVVAESVRGLEVDRFEGWKVGGFGGSEVRRF
jgi:hypothetical protein